MSLSIRPQSECKYDLISLGEIMLRLDPGEGRIRTAREFKAWEGGPNRKSISILGAVLGGFLGILIVIIREFLSKKDST